VDKAFRKIKAGLEDARDGNVDVMPSCGCVFCDLELEPVKRGDILGHPTNDSRQSWVVCTRKDKS
jgi:hypothetical protein